MERTAERVQVFLEAFPASSGAAVTSKTYDMSDAHSLAFFIGTGTAASLLQQTVTATVKQSGDQNCATSAALSGTTLVVGTVSSHVVQNARTALVTFTTATTSNDNVVLNGSTITFATTGFSATGLVYGTTRTSSANDGLNDCANTLSSVINKSTVYIGKGIYATTISTAAIRLSLRNDASTTIQLTGTTNVTVLGEQSQGYIEVLPQSLNSTSRYVQLSIAQAATAVPLAITVVKRSRFSPTFQGVSTATT